MDPGKASLVLMKRRWVGKLAGRDYLRAKNGRAEMRPRTGDAPVRQPSRGLSAARRLLAELFTDVTRARTGGGPTGGANVEARVVLRVYHGFFAQNHWAAYVS
jgi:hypothetical protein